MNENQNNPNKKNRPSNRESFSHQPHHDTHLIALVAMVIIVLAVVWVALTDDGKRAVPSLNERDASTTQPAGEGSDAGTNGPAVGQREVSVSEASSVADLPADLYVSEDGLLRNETTEFSERILVFTTERAFDDLGDSYESFLESEEYEIIQNKTFDRAQKFAAQGPEGEQITVVVSQTDSSTVRRVKINYTPA